MRACNVKPKWKMTTATWNHDVRGPWACRDVTEGRGRKAQGSGVSSHGRRKMYVFCQNLISPGSTFVMRLETQQDSVMCILSQTIVFTSNFSGFMQGSPQRYRHFVHYHKMSGGWSSTYDFIWGIYSTLLVFRTATTPLFTMYVSSLQGRGIVHLWNVLERRWNYQ